MPNCKYRLYYNRELFIFRPFNTKAKLFAPFMRKINFQKHILPHLLAIIVFLVIVFIFFQPVFLTNKTIYQNDILQWEGGARELMDYRDETGEEGLWSSNLFSGMPAFLVNVTFSGDLLLHVKNLGGLFLPHPANQTFTALLCFYILLLAFRVRPYLALIGAVAFGLNSYNIINIEAGHNMKGWAIAYMPLVLAGIHMSFDRISKAGKITGYLLTALALALHLRTNHLQMTYYLLLIVLIYGLVFLIQAFRRGTIADFLKTTGILVVAAILALGTSFGKLWTVYEYGKYSIRGKANLTAGQEEEIGSGLDREYAFQWSNGIAETLTLIIPGYYGGGSAEKLDEDSNFARFLQRNGVQGPQLKQYLANVPTYFGDQPFTSGPIYAGAIVCFLFILGLFVVEKPIRYWLLATTILSLMLSWGKNFEEFNYFMFDYFPYYNKFRSVSMAITIALICMPLLGFVGLERLINEPWTKKRERNFLISAGIAAGLCLLVWLLAGTGDYTGLRDSQLPEQLIGALEEDRQDMRTDDAFRSLIFILLATAAIYFYQKKTIPISALLVGLGLFITVDLWAVDKRYLTEENFVRDPRRQFFAMTEADQFILQDQALSYRVFNLPNPWQEARTSYHHQSIGGYHGAKMRRYQELIDHCLGQDYAALIGQLQSGSMPSFADYDVINMLNAKYLLAGNTRNAVLVNEEALGNAWFVEEVVPVNSPDEEMATLCEIDTETQAVIDANSFNLSQKEFNSNGRIVLETFEPNYLKYQSTLEGTEKGLAVFSEIFYPLGWQAYIDGVEVDHQRVNYVLRALEVPAGTHTIEFRFNSNSYQTGNIIMWISNILLLGMLVVGLVLGYKNLSNPTEDKE